MDAKDDVGAVAQQAEKLFGTAVDKIVAANEKLLSKAADTRPVPLFFPNGIELIYLKFKVGTNELTIAVAGKDAPIKIPTLVDTGDGGSVYSG